MPRLTFESAHDTDLVRHVFVFYASDGEKRFACYLPYEEVSDFHHLPGNADVKNYFDRNLAERSAQASYDAHGLAADGSLIIQLNQDRIGLVPFLQSRRSGGQPPLRP